MNRYFVMLTGPFGIGKSTTGRHVAQLTGCRVLHSDGIVGRALRVTGVPRENPLRHSMGINKDDWDQLCAQFDCANELIRQYRGWAAQHRPPPWLVLAEGQMYSSAHLRALTYNSLGDGGPSWRFSLLLYKPPSAVQMERSLKQAQELGVAITEERIRSLHNDGYRLFQPPLAGEPIEHHGEVGSEEEIVRYVRDRFAQLPVSLRLAIKSRRSLGGIKRRFGL